MFDAAVDRAILKELSAVHVGVDANGHVAYRTAMEYLRPSGNAALFSFRFLRLRLDELIKYLCKGSVVSQHPLDVGSLRGEVVDDLHATSSPFVDRLELNSVSVGRIRIGN
ncbi:MAG: hypothetical protein HW389_1981 [Bacteroidetes bacterium]|nr:hypothetical protein [Bacteroidota bacterium]